MTNSQLESIFNEALKLYVKKEPLPELTAEFYRYTGLSSTIRLRQGRVFARVSDILQEAPAEILFALACILIAKLYRRKVSPEHQATYRTYIANPLIMDASESLRRERGRKLTTSPQGHVYDLCAMFDELNARYFAGRLPKPTLSWSQRPARRILGHHDNTHNTIIISRALDTPRTPRTVVEFVLYHEMLHIKHERQTVNGRKVIHSREFRLDEMRFDKFHEAKNWLEQIATPVRRRRRRKPAR
ncbi:MAG: SprT-like domain-containing protein [Acidobacteriota bacterium]